jgi:hypothetical protein
MFAGAEFEGLSANREAVLVESFLGRYRALERALKTRVGPKIGCKALHDGTERVSFVARSVESDDRSQDADIRTRARLGRGVPRWVDVVKKIAYEVRGCLDDWANDGVLFLGDARELPQHRNKQIVWLSRRKLEARAVE